ncbi:hypothetical protein FIBSPDRAFT_961858 [Athelia psychrophila]|uniref:Uncharacterized protein n=1 Tax=Athelia psychrophila TaxID=1759441 RepID=A0A167UQY0_9AGAM|nr:hypothetical protein FIBSPDRAFT_968344 [Fibularhizoctonia sp. CBS 109695]KZP11921.1 hypothetical protein FIBSPDRAFT_961858 [Fibularhizoctonia sp. CBS 109695]
MVSHLQPLPEGHDTHSVPLEDLFRAIIRVKGKADTAPSLRALDNRIFTNAIKMRSLPARSRDAYAH